MTGPEIPEPHPEPVQQLFEAHARRAPEALAVAWGDRAEDRLTYGELERRANQLAHQLRKLGVRSESLAAILLERSPETVISVLATVKAGGAWLPIDPANPAERIAAMLRDCAAAALLTTAAQLERLPGLPDPPLPPERVLLLDRDGFSGEGTEPPEPFAIDPDHLAYVIYTSGSTGVPKGAALTYRGVANLIGWDHRTFERRPQDRASLLAGPGFDATVWEIWPALAAGCSLHIPRRETVLSPAALLDWLAAERITLAFLATPLAEALLERMNAAPLPPGFCLRALLAGGDRLVRRPRPDQPFLLVNGYGPTETTVFATAGPVSPAGTRGIRAPDIGSPLDNTRIHLVDPGLRPVPVGETGELYIAGAGLGRGYRGRPELTAERFVPNPLDATEEAPGQRMYRTGDLARWLPGGTIEFLGRVDHQVKIRGIRIELGEIESVLASQPEVAAAVVTVREDATGDRGLVAYVVAPTGIGAAELRERLARRLPAAMVPAAWVFLDALPLNPNGKLDRRALERIAPAPETEAAEGALDAPRTPGEQILAGLFREVLKLERRLSLHDDFFHLGGHSLSVFQLASRAGAVFGVEVDLPAVFEHPTVAGLAKWIADATASITDGRPAMAPLVPVARGAESPLSYAQQRLWFLDRFERGSSLYNVPVAFQLAGPGLRVPVLAGALDEIVRRHEALRTVYRESADGEPVQVVLPFIACDLPTLPIIDLSALPGARAAAEPLERELADQPFDLARGPLLRCRLLRLDAGEHRLIVAMHHIASDGWSLEVLVRELSELYQAFAQGLPSPLPPLPVQYADFALWQRRALSGEILEAELAWWRERLAGLPPALELPADRPRPARQSFRGDLRRCRLAPHTGAGLAALSRCQGATLFMTLAAAFYALLGRYTGEEDLALGTPIAGRNSAETQGLIGFFVNTLVLRTSLAGGTGDVSFLELLARVRTTALNAYAHQDLPFEQLVAELAPQRDLARSPLFQVLFAVWEKAPALRLSPDLTGSIAELPTSTAKVDLFLQVARDGDELLPTAEYATDLFDAATVDRLLEHLSTLLASVAATPETRLSELPLLPAAERQQILAEWNPAATPIPETPLQQLFEAHARRAPDALAVAWQGGSLTYGELDRRANHLAHRLRELGAGPESLVALLLDRSPETVIAVVATVKAGGAWLPIDPANPGERIATMLSDSGATVLLTTAAQLERLPGPPDLPLPPGQVLKLDGFAAESAEPPEPFAVDPDQLAFVIYTSGSTGVPKGAALTYRGVANLVAWTLRTFEWGSRDRSSLLAGPGFDATVWEIWPALAAGGSLHVPRRESILSPPALLAWLAAERITLAFLATPLAEALLEEMQARPPLPDLALRALMAGGDRLIHRPRPGYPFRLVNGYGPTETTVFATAGAVAPAGGRAPDIGSPLDNTRIYLADRHLRPVPVGLPGELYIAGAGLGRGYRGRPELTAERFVPNPLDGQPGQRMYRTGDLARWLPGGRVEFLGRIDHQVKIRGIRIELGEIESVLTSQPEVAAAVVTVRVDMTAERGDRRLVAYVVAPESIGQEELRERLARRLPAAMVPAAWVFLEALPLNPNGKLDRLALERIVPPETEAAEGALDAPRTPGEQILADLFREVLKLERPLGLHDDFFHFGGHSLLVVRLASRAGAVFGVDVDIPTVFEHPTVAGLAGWIAGATAGRPAAVPLIPVARGAESPLSYAQQRLWFLDRFESGGTALYNVPVAFHLVGPGLRVPALHSALAEIVRRHEALRTVFRESADGEPVQAAQPFVAVNLPMIDLSGLPGSRTAAEPLERELAEQPFDLARGPLLRCRLLRLGAGEHRLVVSMHHIVSDAWSLEVLAREISELYRASDPGLPSPPAPLPPLPVQYADFALWQRRTLAGETLESELAWWRERLAGLPPALELPADRSRPARQSYRGGLRHRRVEPRATAGLTALSRDHGATLFMTLLAAFYTLLSRYTGEEDLVAGTPTAGRGNAETQGLIGFFVNTLVLRTSLAGDPSFLGLLARVRTTALDAYTHQDLPFEQLVARLAPQRDLARTPLVQVLFAMQETTPELSLSPGLTGSMAVLETSVAKFDLALQISRIGDELCCDAEYATDLFDAATIDRLLAHLGTLLAGVVGAPETLLSRLPLLTAAEREQLAAWNATDEPRPAGATLHGLFETQAARTPDAVAVIAEEGTLTYRDLDARAGRLTRRLAALGAGVDSRVGLFLERSLEMVVAQLAVLKAGAAYVPLDPDYPVERLAAMLEDAPTVAVLAQERFADRLPAGARALFVDGGREADGDPPAIQIVPEEAAAYLIFTSGSTGRPKATTVPHRAIVNYLLWMQAEFPLGSADRVLQKTPFGFDASVWVFWAPLLAGATLVLATPGEHREPAALIRRIREHAVTVLPTVPSLLQALLQEDRFGDCRSLRRVFCGGEALGADLQDAFFNVFTAREAELVNLYGPTETTVAVTFWRCERGPASRPAPLGEAIPNARLHVLGSRLEPCPVGVPGELFVGGAPVSRGYLGRAEESASRFLPDPMAAEPGSRLYRTGDRVRRRPDGRLEYLGRADDQVKIRGVRVELGEVEATLAALPGVRAAAALVQEDEPGDPRLVAYVVADRPDLIPQELRHAVRARLPEAMTPSLIVRLDSLPLTPNGKVDRRALSALDFRAGDPRPGARPEHVAPRTPLEERIAGLWSTLLKVDRLGVHDDFWELGGHSLLATRLAYRVRESFGVELPVRTLFERPTLAGYAAAIASSLEGERAERMTRRTESGPAPLSHAQQRLWFLDRLLPGLPVYNLPVLFGIAGPLAAGALAAALAEIVRRHDVLRTTFTVDAESGDPVQVVAGPAPGPLPQVDLAGLPAAHRAAEAQRLLAAEQRVPFDLERGPLLRSFLVRLGPEDHRLALTMHHIVSDGWSVGVLRRELQALYGAAVTGAPSPLPEIALQYADFSVWQRRWLADGEWEAQLAWWRQTLAGAPPTLDLPTDHPRPAVQSLRGDQEALPLGPALADEVARLGRRRGTTPFMTLLAAFAALLFRYTGQEDLWVGTPIANRRHAETENLLGLFVNTLVLRVGLGGDPTFAELLGRVRETALAAYAHQDLPFERLVEELAPARDLSRSPLFQVLFAAESERAAPIALAPGVTLEALAVDLGAAKLDLSLSVEPGPEGPEAVVEWATDLFETATIRRLLAHFRRLIAAAAGNPEARISELPLFTPEEREEVVALGRRALPAPEPRRAEWEFIAPRTPLEEEVAAIWRKVLRVDRVGIHDSFWDLGGHSLIATKVLARVREAFDVDLPLQSLFAAPRLAEFADAVGQSVLAAQGADTAALLAELEGLSDEEIRSFLAAEETP